MSWCYSPLTGCESWVYAHHKYAKSVITCEYCECFQCAWYLPLVHSHSISINICLWTQFHLISSRSDIKVSYVTISFYDILIECPPGMHRHGNNECRPCPHGTYMNIWNTNTSCFDCPVGTTTLRTGSDSVDHCAGKLV